MTEANKDVTGAIENNEQEMIDEGAPVQPSTDPELNGGDDDPAGKEGDDSSDEEADSSASDASELPDEPVQETDLDIAAEAENAAEGAEGAESAENAEADDDGEYRRRLREYTRELKKQPGDWYIIQSYSGYENKVKTNLEMRSQTLEVEDSIYEVVVPIEQALEKNKDGKNKLVKRKLLPGYVLVRMDMNLSLIHI